MEIGLLVNLLAPEGKSAEVRMTVKVKPDPRAKPYDIELEVAGYFSLKHGTTADLQSFCQTLAPAILFPYIRQIVDRTTMDGRFGNVLLDPMNMMAAIDPSKWATAN